MRPENPLDWTAFVLLLVGAFAWGYFVTDVNILDVALERIWDPLDDASPWPFSIVLVAPVAPLER